MSHFLEPGKTAKFTKKNTNMGGIKHIVTFWLCLALVLQAVAQQQSRFPVKGTVVGKENNAPISGVTVRSQSGQYSLTNALGEFTLSVHMGEEIVFESPEFETVKYIIKSRESIQVQVEGYGREDALSKRSGSAEELGHQRYLDSANYYKKTDIKKSVDFITQSIAQLGPNPDKKELASSLTALGEVYQFHGQYDLAIDSYLDAQEAHKTSATALLLGKAYLLTKEWDRAEEVLLPLLDIKGQAPYQHIEVLEALGDVNVQKGSTTKAVAYYQEGLKVAKKNQISPKETDLNSKIADAYARGDRNVEAEGYYNQSLKLANSQAPTRALEEKEKVADFYNKRNQYDAEIGLRKESLRELQGMASKPKVRPEGSKAEDSITTQRINYKIANAYIAQQRDNEAIPFLQRSIVEADADNDLVVQKDATRKLSEVYRRQGDPNKALETYQKYVALVDTLYVRKEQEISRAARFSRELAERQSRISSLEQERELSQSRYDLAVAEQQLAEVSNKRQKWIIVSLIAGLLLMGLTAYFFYRSNKQQQLANNLLALRSLRTQMNPHFIFNALNSVNNYIAKSDERSANRYLSDFSQLMRSVLENSDEDFIPLAKELELLGLYLKLEHARFPDKFDYSLEVSEGVDADAFQIPPMLLQPYVENAVWHGLRYKEDKGFLKVAVQKTQEGLLQIVILDDGIGRKKSAELKTDHQKKQRSKGMGNIQKRIEILNQMHRNRIAVQVADLKEDHTGTRVTLTIHKA